MKQINTIMMLVHPFWGMNEIYLKERGRNVSFYHFLYGIPEDRKVEDIAKEFDLKWRKKIIEAKRNNIKMIVIPTNKYTMDDYGELHFEKNREKSLVLQDKLIDFAKNSLGSNLFVADDNINYMDSRDEPIKYFKEKLKIELKENTIIEAFGEISENSVCNFAKYVMEAIGRKKEDNDRKRLKELIKKQDGKIIDFSAIHEKLSPKIGIHYNFKFCPDQIAKEKVVNFKIKRPKIRKLSEIRARPKNTK